jgi:hypothetical protein
LSFNDRMTVAPIGEHQRSGSTFSLTTESYLVALGGDGTGASFLKSGRRIVDGASGGVEAAPRPRLYRCLMHEGRAMDINLPLIAGTISTTIFAVSTLPMLRKAFKTKDLRSYSLGQILLANVGNLIHSVYVFHLPAGPIWLLHSFYLLTTALMLVWYLRYQL